MINFMASTDNLQSRFPRGVEVVGSSIIENAEGKILVAQSPQWKNKWTMPGGHIEPGETIEAGLLREAEEEIGLKLKSKGVIAFGELIGSKDYHRPAHFVYFDLLCEVEGGQVAKLDGEELTDYRWVTPAEALKMDLAESYAETIEKYMEYKKRV